MKNLKDYIGKNYNIICDNKEEWDAIVDLAIEIGYAFSNTSLKSQYTIHRYLCTEYESLCPGNSTLRTEIKASEFISPKTMTLLDEAKAKYPIGTKYKCPINNEIYTIKSMNWRKDSPFDRIFAEGGCGSVYHDGKWAEIIEIPVIETPKVEYIEITKQNDMPEFYPEIEQIGKILKVYKNGINAYKVFVSTGTLCIQKDRVKPSTKEAYDRQEASKGKTIQELLSPRYVKWINNLGYDRKGKMLNTFIKNKVFDTNVDNSPIFEDWKETVSKYYFNFVEVGEQEYNDYHKMNGSLVTKEPEFKKGDKVLIVQDYSTGDGSNSAIQGTIGTFVEYNTRDNAEEYPYVAECAAHGSIKKYCVHKIEHYKEKKSLDLSKPFCILLTLDNQVRVQDILGSSYFNNKFNYVFSTTGKYYGVDKKGSVGRSERTTDFNDNVVTIEELEQAYYSLNTQPIGILPREQRPVIIKDTYKVVGLEKNTNITLIKPTKTKLFNTYIEPIKEIKVKLIKTNKKTNYDNKQN